MKQVPVLFFLTLFLSITFAPKSSFAVNTANPTSQLLIDFQYLSSYPNLTLEKFVDLSPKEITTHTGKKLNLFESIALRKAQKRMDRQLSKVKASHDDDLLGDIDIDQLLIYILCWLLPPLAIYMIDGFSAAFLLNLLLTLSCGIPGIIHGFIVAYRHFNN